MGIRPVAEYYRPAACAPQTGMTALEVGMMPDCSRNRLRLRLAHSFFLAAMNFDHDVVIIGGNWDRASTSVPLNIAEGNGKFTSPDRCRFFDNARGSALESAACLDVLVAKQFVSASDVQAGKAKLVRIVSMLFGLIRANSDTRVFEGPTSYRAEKTQKNKSRSKNTNTSRNRKSDLN